MPLCQASKKLGKRIASLLAQYYPGGPGYEIIMKTTSGEGSHAFPFCAIRRDRRHDIG